MIVNRHHLQSPVEIIEAQLNIPQDYKQECINEIYKIGNTNSEPSNVHGIRSTYKVWKETKILDPLLNYIQNTINELYKSKFTGDYFSISSSWSIIYKKDDYAKPHIHLPNTWAFVYYLKSSGRTPIIFNDINFSINPIDDMLLVFPATLKHSVPPHEGDEDRICVAGNMHADR